MAITHDETQFFINPNALNQFKASSSQNLNNLVPTHKTFSEYSCGISNNSYEQDYFKFKL